MSTRGHRSGSFRFAGTRIGRLMLAGPLVGLMSVPALAGPEGEQVVHGSAQFTRNGANTIIRTSNRAIINYTGFNLNRNESVRFIQPGANSRVLNRIQSDAPTFIDGSIRANGNVYFVNNAGIVFGQNAVINVGGLYAAAGNISNRDFLAGRDRFTDLSGEVVNNGRIEAGSVGLVGHRVANYGSIVAPEGLVTMAAGDDVYIGERGGHVFARISASEESADGGGIVQAGTIESRGTMLSVGDHFALAVLDSSSIRAERLTVQGGRNGSEVSVAGEIDATSADGVGGRVDVFGDTVRLDGATIDASGRLGGGVIRIGGDYQGGGLSPTSTMTLITSDTLLKSDALLAGRGGRVIVWADGFTGFAGYISARGGALNGDGGFVEVSGKDTLAYRGLADVRAVNGRSGTLLLDPRIINIEDGAAGEWPLNAEDGSLEFHEDPAVVTITDGELINQLNLLGDGQLLLQASTDIRVHDGVRVEFTGGGESFDGLLILEAGRRIRFIGDARLDLDTGSLRLIANSDAYTPSKMARLPGAGDINMSADSRILTDGGTVELFVQDLDESGNIFISTIDAGVGGTVRVSHTGVQGASNHHIQQVAGGLGITATTVELNAIDGGSIGLNAGARLMLNADNLTVLTDNSVVDEAGGDVFLSLTGATNVGGITTSGGDLDIVSGSSLVILEDIDTTDPVVGAGDAIIVADQITGSGGGVTAARVSLDAITGRIGDSGDRLSVTTDLLSARAETGVFLETEALGGGAMTIGDFGGLSGITSNTNRIELIHTGDLVLDADLTATGHGLSTDVIRVDADTVTINATGGADAGATGGIVFNTDSFLIDGDMGMAGREVTLNVGAGGVTVNAVFGAAFEEVTIDTLGELAINAGGRLATTGTLTTTALTYDIADGDGLSGDDALTVRGREDLLADLPFLDELETTGTLTLAALDGDLTIGGQAGVFLTATDVLLDATGLISLGGVDPTEYQFNEVSITAGGGIDFGAGVTGLTSAGSVLLDAGNDEIVNIQQVGLFTVTAGASGTTLNSSVTAAGSLTFDGEVHATAFDGLPSRGTPVLEFNVVGTLAFNNGLDATGIDVDIIAANGTLGGSLIADRVRIINDLISVGANDHGGFWVTNAYLDFVEATALHLSEAGGPDSRIFLDGIATNFTGTLTTHADLIEASGADSAVDNIELLADEQIVIDGVGLETTGVGRNLRLEAAGGVVMSNGAVLTTSAGLVDLHSDVTGVGDATFDSSVQINGGGIRSIRRDNADNGIVRFEQDVFALNSDDPENPAGLLVDAAAGRLEFGSNAFIGQAGAFSSIELAADGGIFADASIVLVSNGPVTLHNDLTAAGDVDIVGTLTTLGGNLLTGGGDAMIVGDLLVTGPRTVDTATGDFEVTGTTTIDDSFDLMTAGGNASFGGRVLGSGAGVGTFRLDTGTGDLTFDGAIGRTGADEDRHLALFQITLADEVFFRGGRYEAAMMSLDATTLRIELAGGGVTEFRSRGGTMDFLGGGFSLATGNDLLLTATEGGNVFVSGVFADTNNGSSLTARIEDDISLLDLGGAGAALRLVDVEANRVEVKGVAHADQFVFTADWIGFTGGAKTIFGREMTLAQRDEAIGINLGGDGSDATRLNITQDDILALNDGFAVVRVGNDETEDLRVLANPGDVPLAIRDPFELRSETSVSFLGDVEGTGDASLRVFSGDATLLNANITLENGALIFTDLAGGPGQVVIRGAVSLRTGGGSFSMLGSIDGDPNESNTLFVDAETGQVLVGSVGLTSALADLTLLGGVIELDQIGNATKVGVSGTTLVEAFNTLTFLGGVYNTNAASYSARQGMFSDRTLSFMSNDSDISFGSTAQRGRGSITFGTDDNWKVDAGEGIIGLDGVYTGDSSNMILTGSRIMLNGNTAFVNPDGFVDFVGSLIGRRNLDMTVADGRVRFREVGSDTGSTQRLRDTNIEADRIDFLGTRFDADSARFEADRYEVTHSSTASRTDFLAWQGDLVFDGGELRFSLGDLALESREGAVRVAQIRGGSGTDELEIRAQTFATISGIGSTNGSGVQHLLVQADDMDLTGDLFVRGRTLIRPSTDGRDILVGSILDLDNDALEVSQAMLSRFVSTDSNSTLSVGGFSQLNDLESALAGNSFSESRIEIGDVSIDHQISFFGSNIELLGGSTLTMTDGAGVRLSSTGVSRLNGAIVSEGGTIVVNGEQAILSALIDSNGGDIIIRSENAFVDQGAELSTLGGPRDGDFIVDGGVDGLVDGEGDFVLNVGRGDIILAPGRGFGQTRRLRSVELTANTLGLSNVFTTGDQTFTGTELLGLVGGTLDSLTGDILFNNDVLVVGEQTVRVGDGTIFMNHDIVGAEGGSKIIRPALTLEAAGGQIHLRGDASELEAFIVDGEARVFGDRTFRGREVRFLGDLDSGAGRVTLGIHADDIAELSGNVGGLEPFRSVTVSAGDQIVLGRSGEDIRIDTLGFQRYEGDTRIAGDVFLQAHGFDGEVSRQDSILFVGDILGTTAGADTLTAIVDRTGGEAVNDLPPRDVPIIAFGGNIGTEAVALGGLNLNFVDGQIDGRVNADDVAFASMVATIVFGDIDAFVESGATGSFDVFANDMNIGRGEALTVIGDASFRGVRGRVSDVSTLGDLSLVFSERLTIANRVAGQTFDPTSEQLTDDEAADLISGGGMRIVTSSLVIDNGDETGLGIVSFAAGGADLDFQIGGSLPSGVQLRSLPSNTDTLFIFDLNTLPGGGGGEALLSDRFIALDVRAAGPSNTNIAEAIAGAVQNADSGQVESGTVVEATIRDILRELGLEPRGYAVDYPENEEARAIVTETMLGSLQGAGLFVDVANIDGVGGIETTIERLDRNLTTQVVTQYLLLWYGPRDENGQLLPPPADAPTGGLVPYDRSETRANAILASFDEVTEDCRVWLESNNPEAAEAREIPADIWMNFLIERSEQYPAASQYVVELERLLHGLREMGLSQDELRRVWVNRLRLAVPRGLDREGFRQLLTGEVELEVAANPEYNGLEPVIEME